MPLCPALAPRSALAIVASLAVSAGLTPADAFAQSVTTGYSLDVYAPVPDPLKLSFSPGGDLFVGRNPAGDPGGSSRIHRVGPGGTPVVEYGPPLSDPDAVLFDADGDFAPIPGSVIVGGIVNAGVDAAIHAIAPDESATTVIGPTSLLDNPSDMTFDGAGRLLFTDHGNQDVKVSTGGTPTTLISLGSNSLSVAYDPTTDRVYSNALDGVIRIHQSNGTLIDGSFATSDEAVTVGPGDAWFGNDVYTVNNSTGELLRIDLSGTPSVIGTGFAGIRDLEFGPDGALYASDATNHRILRVGPPAIPLLPPGTAIPVAALLSLFGWRTMRPPAGRR